jgi:alpha-beta hydrolase superfamily lysophospholipase
MALNASTVAEVWSQHSRRIGAVAFVIRSTEISAICVKNVSHIFYEGARHEPLRDFCRDQMHADVVTWLDAHLS